jgi:hypothetical protein
LGINRIIINQNKSLLVRFVATPTCSEVALLATAGISDESEELEFGSVPTRPGSLGGHDQFLQTTNKTMIIHQNTRTIRIKKKITRPNCLALVELSQDGSVQNTRVDSGENPASILIKIFFFHVSIHIFRRTITHAQHSPSCHTEAQYTKHESTRETTRQGSQVYLTFWLCIKKV